MLNDWLQDCLMESGFLTRGCATALGVTYAAMLLIQDNMGRLALPERLGLIYSE